MSGVMGKKTKGWLRVASLQNTHKELLPIRGCNTGLEKERRKRKIDRNVEMGWSTRQGQQIHNMYKYEYAFLNFNTFKSFFCLSFIHYILPSNILRSVWALEKKERKKKSLLQKIMHQKYARYVYCDDHLSINRDVFHVGASFWITHKISSENKRHAVLHIQADTAQWRWSRGHARREEH